MAEGKKYKRNEKKKILYSLVLYRFTVISEHLSHAQLKLLNRHITVFVLIIRVFDPESHKPRKW